MNKSVLFVEIPQACWGIPVSFPLITVAMTAKEAGRFIRKGYDLDHRRGVFLKMGKVARRQAIGLITSGDAMVLQQQDPPLVSRLCQEGLRLNELSDVLCRLIHEPATGVSEALYASRILAQRLAATRANDSLRHLLQVRIQLWEQCLERGSGTIEILSTAGVLGKEGVDE